MEISAKKIVDQVCYVFGLEKQEEYKHHVFDFKTMYFLDEKPLIHGYRDTGGVEKWYTYIYSFPGSNSIDKIEGIKINCEEDIQTVVTFLMCYVHLNNLYK